MEDRELVILDKSACAFIIGMAFSYLCPIQVRALADIAACMIASDRKLAQDNGPHVNVARALLELHEINEPKDDTVQYLRRFVGDNNLTLETIDDMKACAADFDDDISDLKEQLSNAQDALEVTGEEAEIEALDAEIIYLKDEISRLEEQAENAKKRAVWECMTRGGGGEHGKV